MTYVISAITNESILMASDSRLNYHNEEIDRLTGEKFQSIIAIADCIRKTFLIKPFNVGIQFMGIGYFPEKGNKYPLSYFIPRLSANIESDSSIETKFLKIYNNLKKLTQTGNTGQYVNGIMTGYEDDSPFIATFNTFIDDLIFNSYEAGAYAESQSCNEKRPEKRNEAINYINKKIANISQERPHDVGGPIEILEIKPDGSNFWVQENFKIFNGDFHELIYKLNHNPASIDGKILSKPVKQKLSI